MRMTSAHRLAGAAAVALLLAACGQDAVPKIQLASSPPRVASVASAEASSSAPAPAPAGSVGPQVTPNAVATKDD